MKRINTLIIALFIAVFSVSCDSLLDIDTKHALPQEKIQSVEGCRALIVGTYDLMQSPTYLGRDLIVEPEILADNLGLSPNASRYTNLYQFQPNYQIDIWTSAYEIISALNEALASLEKLEQTDAVTALKGEALFLRAYNYFYLANVYARTPKHLVGNFDLCVPLVLEPFYNDGGNIAEQASVERNNVDVVWNKIITDLNDAFSLLNGNDSGLAPERASAIAAKAFLSRVYLYHEDWDDAVNAATYVLTNSKVKIYKGNTYTDIFKKDSESLFELVYAESENLASSGLHSIYGTVDDGKRDADGFGNGIGAGDGNCAVPDAFVDLFDQTKDIRFGALRKVMRSGVKMWWSTKFNSWKGTFGMDNIPLIRISEVLLNRAEAYAHLADNTSLINARTDIDELRKNRGLDPTDVPNSGLLDEILLQRRIELAFEGHRFFDLKRLGKDILRSNSLPTVEYSDYRVVSPLPTKELDVNKKLKNNPGY